MLTPQEVQEKTFGKAVFGGYDMQAVDEFLESLTKDYNDLYKENAVLKSKMRVLVKKLEEYRDQEESMKAALLSAQKTCDNMIKEAQQQCDEMRRQAESDVSQRQTADLVAQEQERLDYAKQAALNFIDVVEHDIRGHLELLESLKSRDLSTEKAEAKPQKPYDFDRHEPEADPAKVIAGQIDESLSRMGLTVEEEPTPAVDPIHKDSPTIKFEDLQFGKNYDPRKED